MNFRALFSSPKKAAAVIACLLAVVAAMGIGIACVAGGNGGGANLTDVIGAENARHFALADAGVDPASAQAVQVSYERFEENFVYSVEFVAGGTEYSYKINAADGAVVKKESRTVQPDSTVPLSAAVTLERAQEIALADAGVSREDAIFSRAETGTDNGLSVYRFQFYASNVEYEYSVDASTGAVYSKKTVIYGGEPGTASPARTEAPAARPDPTAEPTRHPAAEQPTKSDAPAASAPQPTGKPSGMYIGMSAAKSAALSHAGVGAAEARFTQVGMDYEDGAAVYALKFYTSDREYEYKIDARTGAVLSRGSAERSN